MTAQGELLQRCEDALKQNIFLKNFRIMVDPHEQDWVKYEILYRKLAIHLNVSGSSNKQAPVEKKEQKDALTCLELLIEVLTLQPSAILPDLIHLTTKGNLMKARNEVIQQVNNTLTLQRQ